MKINEIRMAHYEALATADGRTVGIPTLVVDAAKSTRIVHITFFGPLHISAEGTVVSQDGGETRSNPNGVPKPLGMAAFPLVANQLPYLALVGYVCDDTGCDEANPIFIGSGTTVCPSQVSRIGRIELIVNEGRLASFFGDNQGGYRIRHEPAQAGVCP
jgi:hypothetical protein